MRCCTRKSEPSKSNPGNVVFLLHAGSRIKFRCAVCSKVAVPADEARLMPDENIFLVLLCIYCSEATADRERESFPCSGGQFAPSKKALYCFSLCQKHFPHVPGVSCSCSVQEVHRSGVSLKGHLQHVAFDV